MSLLNFIPAKALHLDISLDNLADSEAGLWFAVFINLCTLSVFIPGFLFTQYSHHFGSPSSLSPPDMRLSGLAEQTSELDD